MNIPELSSIAVVEIHPGDVLVIRCKQTLSNDMANRLVKYVESVFPNNKAVVLSDGIELEIFRDKGTSCDCGH